MPDKKTRNKQNKSSDNRDARRQTWIRIILIGFSIILILSMILSLAATTT